MGKEIVRLRQKPLKDGSVSLYLDIYVSGQRNYEFLKLYLVPEKTRQDKAQNKETMRLAEVVKSQRIVEIERGEYGLGTDKNVTFGAFFRDWIEGKRAKGKEVRIEESILKTLEPKFGRMRLSKITSQALEEMQEKIIGIGLKDTTREVYLRKVRTLLYKAAKSGYIRYEVVKSVDIESADDVERNFLNIDEVRRLAETPTKYTEIKRAFLFSCLTGLRSVDIKALTWGEIKESNGFTRIVFNQIKTGGLEYLDLNEQAVGLLGERNADNSAHIFTFDKKSSVMNSKLRRWIKAANIDKDITFHCARHTFACMMLEIDTNIAVIQKLLGHKKIDTTMIYTKVVDKSKRDAISRIPKIFEN